jgi:hypothetical protein
MKARKSMICFSTIFVFVLMHLVLGRVSAQTEKIRLEDLAKKAEVIVVGKVTDVRSEWNADKTKIITKVSLDVDEYVKGEPAGKTMVITHMGGEVDGVGELYSHTPAFSKGEDVLVFVKKDNKNNLNVAGGNEGKFKVTKNESTGERMLQSNLSLKNFTSMVKTALKQQKME